MNWLTKRSNQLSVSSLLWVALFLALAGSLKHLAAIFASIDGNIFMGWVQAIAIDAGVFALAYSLKLRKMEKRSVKPIWFGVVVFTAISVYGNLAYGLFATTGNFPAWVMASKPVVLAASLPILVLFLSELLSDDRQYAAKEAKREAKRTIKLQDGVTVLPKIATSNSNKLTTKEERKQKLTTLYRQKPEATITELATLLNVSRGTVRNYASELGIDLAGSIGTNGNSG